MLELIPTVIVAAIGFYLFDRQAKRSIEAIRSLEVEHRAERAELLTRIQAPELAPTLTSPEPSEEPMYVPFDDDRAHDKYVERVAGGDLI